MLNSSPVDSVFQALAEPTRRAIVERLSRGAQSVSELAAPFDLTLAAVVQHLQVLERSGLIVSEKVGRVRTCRIDAHGLSLAEGWLSERRSLWERRFDALAELLGEQPAGPPAKRTRRKR